MKIKLINIYSFPVRANTDWLILEIVSENNIKGYSELTMSNYYKRDELISITKKLIKKLSNKDVENDNQVKEVLEENREESLIFNTSVSGIRSACSDIFSKIKRAPMNIYLAELKKRKISNSVELYANINRSLLPNNDGPVDRSPNSFFNMAKRAKNAGFKKIKCAPFDGFENEEYEDRKFISRGIDKVSLGIRHIGIENAKIIADFTKTMKNFFNLAKKNKIEDLINIDGIGETQIKSLEKFFQNKINIKVVEKLSEILKIKDREIKRKGKLNNKSFMFTGKLQNISRAEAKSLIEENSGSIVSSVTKKLDYLVIGEKPTNRKLEQAKNLGIQIITQKEWSNLLN